MCLMIVYLCNVLYSVSFSLLDFVYTLYCSVQHYIMYIMYIMQYLITPSLKTAFMYSIIYVGFYCTCTVL